MKKKIISLILVLMLLPIASLFTACGKDKGYNLNALNTDFNHIKNENGKFVFDYSSYENLDYIIRSYNPYVELLDYNYVFYNLMSFAYEYVPVCSNNFLTKEVGIKNQVRDDLVALKKSIGDVNKCVNMFASCVIDASGEEITSFDCLTRFENLLSTYEDMFKKASNFNNSLSNLYFNYALRDGNPDVYSIGLENFDSSVVISKLRARIKYQISSLSQNFVEIYIDGDLDERIAKEEKTFELDSEDYPYKSMVESIDKTFEEETATEIINKDQTKKETFYNLSVQAQNIQAIMNNDKDKFIIACNNIDYGLVVKEATITPYEQMCVDIIDGNYQLVCDYNYVLTEMLKTIV